MANLKNYELDLEIVSITRKHGNSFIWLDQDADSAYETYVQFAHEQGIDLIKEGIVPVFVGTGPALPVPTKPKELGVLEKATVQAGLTLAETALKGYKTFLKLVGSDSGK